MTPVPPTFTNPITEDDIANYLSNTPDFFQRHAQLLAAVQLTSPHSHRTVSLQERQAELLREKIKVLEKNTMEMLRHGTENVLLSDKIVRWACTLLQSEDALALPARILQDLERSFAVPQAALRVWDVASPFAHASFAQGVSDDVKLFAASLTEPFCGLNTGFEAVSWLAQPADATSLALLPLRLGTAGAAGGVFGLLVLASGDAQRFANGMGTDLLARIADIASAALLRLR
jgi:uncharacterized protein YigA (DUF484 family)